VDDVFEVVGFLADGVVRDALHEGHHAVWEVVLGQPRYNLLLLHVWSRGHIENQVPQLLPVPAIKLKLKLWYKELDTPALTSTCYNVN
jgi:hypothetical protein